MVEAESPPASLPSSAISLLEITSGDALQIERWLGLFEQPVGCG
jgi:hypothetical protein